MAILPALAVIFVYVLLFASMSAMKTDTGAGFGDASNYHLPLINWFIGHGYTLYYPTYSTTAPGFHWLVAAYARVLGAETLALGDPIVVLVPGLLGLGFLLLAFGALKTCGSSGIRSCLLLVPVASSKYFWWSALYPVTESLALVGYATMVWAAVRQPLYVSTFSLGAAIATITRQIYAPVSLAAVACLGSAAWYGCLSWRQAVLRSLAAVAPTAGILLVLMSAWGGLIPPGWDHHKSALLINPVPIAHGIMLVGLLSVPFLRPVDFTQNLSRLHVGASLALAGACWWWLALEYDVDAGRWGSLVWQIAHASPLFLDRPIFLLPLLFLGFQSLFLGWRRARAAGVLVSPELIIFGCYLLALGGQAFSWQRYLEVPALFYLACNLARTKGSRLDIATALVFAAYFAVSVRYL